jgi:hypothetical protein
MNQPLVDNFEDKKQVIKKMYIKPVISQDLELETRAGSVITPFFSPFPEVPKE